MNIFDKIMWLTASIRVTKGLLISNFQFLLVACHKICMLTKINLFIHFSVGAMPIYCLIYIVDASFYLFNFVFNCSELFKFFLIE